MQKTGRDSVSSNSTEGDICNQPCIMFFRIQLDFLRLWRISVKKEQFVH